MPRKYVKIGDVLSSAAALRDHGDPIIEISVVVKEDNLETVRGILLGGETFDRENLEAGGVRFGKRDTSKTEECSRSRGLLFIEIDGKTKKFEIENLCGFRLPSKRELLSIIEGKDKMILQMKEAGIRAAGLIGH